MSKTITIELTDDVYSAFAAGTLEPAIVNFVVSSADYLKKSTAQKAAAEAVASTDPNLITITVE